VGRGRRIFFHNIEKEMVKPKLNGYNTKLTNPWRTPQKLYDSLDSEFHFNGIDPCPLHGADSGVDGLNQSWGSTGECVFVNPPYSNIKPWSMKAREEQLKGITVVMLIPSRTSTAYFHDWVLPFAEVRFLKGRVAFEDSDGNSKGPAPFPSLLAVFAVE
jgi:site-specific DNA-methyltransferase (adenine-specific)